MSTQLPTREKPNDPLRRRWRTVAVCLTAIGLLLTGCSSSESTSAEESVRLVLVPATVSALPLLADAEGMFERNGLTVASTSNQNLASFAPALGRQYDIAWGTPADVILARAQGHDITVISAAYRDTSENQQAQIFASEAGGIDNLAGLRGRRIATPTLAGTLYLALVSTLADAGLTTKDVELVEVPFPNMLDQLEAGRVDAAAVVQPFSVTLGQAGHKALGDPFLTIDDPALAGMWISSTDWVRENEETVESFVDALRKTQKWVDTNEPAARTRLAELLQLPPAVAENVPLPEWTTEATPQDLEPWTAELDRANIVDAKLPSPTDLMPETVG